ncbi:hypothetical protein A1O1_05401 [Capronia coronata CBS 617.96]|uniref:DUF218 domain-containing protein n=1 Tax=Capronia coronata CBS 617.96 TaxID=1182541 RepID=W9YGT7_9EURO|nr:uncharacterized protein A1O1_05401 [Capronia coronata CBS 617.96]EXJ88471.1 hypothetical protein A1O1_05401 [Capronia coronata CBS 617.96]
MSFPSESVVSDINLVSSFLSCPQIPSLQSGPPVDVIVLCASAVLAVADNVFSALQSRPGLAKVLVLCGGIGHSTGFLYEAVGKSKRYGSLANKVDGLPEADVLNLILEEFYPRLREQIKSSTLKLLIENKSTNCGANAIETRRLLEHHETPPPNSVIIVQDPTMSLRTLASFKHSYADVSPLPTFAACPTFVPVMSVSPSATADQSKSSLHFSVPGIQESELWAHDRFFDLIMGEIPRLRDDEHGYGPKGKGYIAYVDIPAEVEDAWTRLKDVLNSNR